MRREWTRIAPYALLAVLSAGGVRAQNYQQPIVMVAQPARGELGGAAFQPAKVRVR